MQQKLRKLVIALAIFGLVAFLANLVVDNPYTHRLIRAAINDAVKGETNLLVDFKAIKVSVVPPGVALYGLHVATNAAPESPLVTAAHVGARLSLWALVLGDVRLSLAEASDLSLVWPPPWNFKGFLKEPGKDTTPPGPVTWPPDFDLPVDEISLRNAQIYLELPMVEQVPLRRQTMVATLVGLNLDVTYDGWKQVGLDLGVKSVNLALGATSMLEETGIEATARLNGKHLATSTLKVKGERLDFDGRADVDLETSAPPQPKTPIPAGKPLPGTPEPLQRVKIALAGPAAGDLSLLGSFLDLSETRGPFKGEVGVDVSIPVEAKNEQVAFRIKGKAGVNDGYFAGFRLFDSATAFDVTPDQVALDDLDVRIGEQSYAKGKGVIKLTDAIDFDFMAAPDGLRLLALLDALGVGFDMVDLGIQSPDLHISGKGAPFALNVSATANFSDVMLPTHPYPKDAFPVPPQCNFDFHLLVTSTQLDFNGTHGFCFNVPKNEPSPVVAGQFQPPQVAAGVSPVDFGGQIVFGKGLELNVRAQGLDLAVGQHFAQIPLAGKGDAGVRIHGPFSGVLIDTKLDAQDVAVMKMPLGAVSAAIGIEGDQIKLSDVSVRPDGGGRIDVRQSSLTLDDQKTFRLKAQARDLSAESVQKIIGGVAPDVGVALAVRLLDADLQGPLLQPLAMKGKATVAVEKLEMDGERLADAITGTIRGTDKGWVTDDLTAWLGDLAIVVKAQHKRAKPFDFAEASVAEDTLTALGASPNDQVDVEFNTVEPKVTSLEEREQLLSKDHLGLLPFAGEPLRNANIKGRIVASGKLNGKAGELQGTFGGSLMRPSVFGSAMSPINFKGFLKGGKLDLVLDHSGNSLEGRVSMDLMKAGVPYEWYFSFNRMDLRALGTEFFHADPRNYIYLTADWRMQGKFQDWWRSTGELKIKDIRGKYVQDIAAQTKTLQIRQEQPVTLLFTKSGWHFEGDRDLYLSGRNIQLRLSMADNKPPEKLGIKVESIVDVGIAKEFSQAIDTAAGKLRVTCDITGPVADPKVVVEITDLKNNPFIATQWTPVTIGLSDIRPAFRNVSLRVLIKDGKLIIDTLQAQKGSGTVTATGTLALTESEEESRLEIGLNDATVVYPVAFLKNFETQLTGNVVVSGKGVPYRISGDIDLVKARSTKEVDIRDEIINALRQKSFTTTIVNEKPTVILDLNITADQSINIHNRNLQSVLSADLAIKGTDIAPSVSGQVEVDKGKFIYKRDFQITRGLVTFDDPVKPDPSLDILAMSEVDAYRVYIAITGRASNPTVEFSVDPPTRESGVAISKLEILVLLSRGKLPEENRSLGQETQNAAASEAANLILGQFEEPVEKLFDLSGQNVVRNVYIDTHPSTEKDKEGTPVPRLNLPLDLGEDFDVVFRADQASSEVSAEYNVHENITFSGVLERRRNEDQAQSSATTTQAKAVDADAKVNLKFRFSFE